MEHALLMIVQARMESKRFPGKILAPILGQSMILWEMERLARMLPQYRLVVATPDTPANRHKLGQLLERHGYEFCLVAGNPDDVLERFRYIAATYEATAIVRLCGDCPLIDPHVVERLFAYHRSRSPTPDLTGIAAEWPEGCADAEVISRCALDAAAREAMAPHQREHVSPFVFEQPERFRCATLPCPFDCRNIQTSVDTPYDLEHVEKLLEYLLRDVGFAFGWRDIWHTIQRHAMLRDWQRARPSRNHAYLTQLTQERGTGPVVWDTERYAQHADHPLIT